MAVERRHARALNYDFGRGPLTVIDLEIDEDYDSDVTLPDESVDRGPITPLPNSNPEPELDAMFRPLPTLFSSSMNLRIGKTVELRDGDFLRITEISENRITKQPLLRGLRYRRNSKTHGMLDKHLNEVTLILKHNESDRRHIMKQSMESIIPSAVVKIRSLIESNLPYPTLSYCEAGMPNSSISDIWNNGTLVCRWKLLDHGKNEGVLQMLECNDCDDNHCTDSEALKISFRDETIKGGLSLDWLPGERQYDIQERERCNYNDPLNFHPPFELFDLTTVANGVDPTLKRYTIGDGFCGAGGISRGAKAAGLKVVWGFDFDTAAIESFSLNFSGAYCWAIAAHDLITVITDDLKVDILHLSPPCQTFSPAHTKPGKDDEMNQATFFATRELIKRTKPRIVTLEETFGLIRTENNLRWFKAMVQMFTSLGFSLRWKVFDLRNFGLPQPRRRLFLYASCPGENLPDFPEPTHCSPVDKYRFPYRKPWTTVNDAISSIPKGISMHNPDQVERFNKPPYNGDVPMKSTITCASGVSYHPSGKRDFTLREIACLQGFPLEHEFSNTRARKQIGNAVPPLVAKIFFDQIVRALRAADGL